MIRKGSEVICMHMPRNYGHPLKVGESYIVASMDDSLEWLQVVGSDASYETKYFRLAKESRDMLFKVVVNGGYTYRVRCTDEAMKELAEFIGDDHLVSVEPVTLKKKAS